MAEFFRPPAVSLQEINEMPLLAALKQLSTAERLSFHMPGHRNALGWPGWLRESFSCLDTTELPVTDDLHQPEGPALEAMQKAAAFFGAGKTQLITTGSTTAIQVMISAVVRRGSRILLSRTSHQAVMHVVALLDLKPVWAAPRSANHVIYDRDDPRQADQVDPWQADQAAPRQADPWSDFHFLPQPDAASIAQALARYPDCAAVLLTSPDYYGACADIRAIAQVTKKMGIPLLVDEAHGAHLAIAAPGMPPTALSAGADLCVQSAHKTLPALTPGAFLHISADAMKSRPDLACRVSTMLKLFHTSSPSFPIAASLDYARYVLESRGHALAEALNGHLTELGRSLPDGLRASVQVDARTALHDPFRVVLRFDDAATDLFRIRQTLQAAGIDIEMTDLTRLILIPALDQPADDFRKLTHVLGNLSAHPAGTGSGPNSGFDTSRIRQQNQAADPGSLEKRWLQAYDQIPEQVAEPGMVLLDQPATVRIPLENAVGRVAALPVIPYPPGVPLIWPGERIDAFLLDLIQDLGKNRIGMTGIYHDSIAVLS